MARRDRSSTSPRSRPASGVCGRRRSCWRRCRSCSSRSTCSTSPVATCSRSRCAIAAPRSKRSTCRSGPANGSSSRTSPPRRSAAEVDRHFDDARERRNEGLMVKDPDSTYQPGRRGLGWLKLKKALATLDCVVVGVEWGHGKRRGVLSATTPSRCARPMRPTPAPDHRQGVHRPDRCGDRDDDRALRGDHAQGPRSVSNGRARGGGRDRLRSDHALRPAPIRLRDALPAHRAACGTTRRPSEIDTLATVEALFGEQASGRILLATGARASTERIAATGSGEEG